MLGELVCRCVCFWGCLKKWWYYDWVLCLCDLARFLSSKLKLFSIKFNGKLWLETLHWIQRELEMKIEVHGEPSINSLNIWTRWTSNACVCFFWEVLTHTHWSPKQFTFQEFMFTNIFKAKRLCVFFGDGWANSVFFCSFVLFCIQSETYVPVDRYTYTHFVDAPPFTPFFQGRYKVEVIHWNNILVLV